MKIAFAGYGLEAESAYHYFKQLYPEAQFVAYDNAASPKKTLPNDITFYGNTNFQNLDADIVVRTPSVAPTDIDTNGIITSVTKEFFKACPVPIIGVTGTKGKGTTASLIAEMLKKAGNRVWLVGNIGLPALDVLEEIRDVDQGVVVYELSSFQLSDLDKSPKVAVVLGVEPEHLDHHGSFEEYVNAKANIARYQEGDDTMIYYAKNEVSVKIANLSSGNKIPYEVIESDDVIFNGKPLMKRGDVRLKGRHNLENIYAALAATSVFTQNEDAFVQVMREFTGLPHRLEERGVREGVLYVNDSFSSAPPATLAAVRSYEDPTTLIMGGVDRGIDLGPLVEELSQEKHLKNIILIGQTAPRLEELFRDKNIPATIADNLPAAFQSAREHAGSGEIILLSPGCASFDMFENFSERGERFRELVSAIPREFIFESVNFDEASLVAKFHYSFDHTDFFTESVQFHEADENYNTTVLVRALFLAHILIGSSYYKLFPKSKIRIPNGGVDDWQANFFNKVFQEGLSQYAFENGLKRQDLGHFSGQGETNLPQEIYEGDGILSLQSGGKDSLLTAALLIGQNKAFDSLYVSSKGSHYPRFIEDLPGTLNIIERKIDLAAIRKSMREGGLNGHVPVTYIVESISLIQAILLNKKYVLASIGHEGEEPHEWIDDLPVNHQWSKTWGAEKLLSEYIQKYISSSLYVGSPLRKFSELRVAQMFSENAWSRFGHLFSSCNIANYQQGNDNAHLKWCGNCPKCANSFLLFAPFVEARELKSLFDGHDLFAKPNLEHTFKGLLGIDGFMKPFECVGEVDELRTAYKIASDRGGYEKLPFDVPEADFDYANEYPSQDWAAQLF